MRTLPDKMKIFIRNTCSFVLLMSVTVFATAQANKEKAIKVQEQTLMYKFEPEYVLSMEKRIALKEERINHQQETKKILDTLNISNRKRHKLMRELRKSPFSERINKTILAETQFDDGIEEEPRK